MFNHLPFGAEGDVMRTRAIINQKGGCGKTTVSINLASSLSSRGCKTLLVDMDPQSHCAVGLAVPEEQIEQSVYDILVSNAGILKAGDLESLDEASFRSVTEVNYTGYFLAAKHASRIMKLQHRFNKKQHHFKVTTRENDKAIA